jgi:VIT1/CCC1 family predicted Fe2+/Mn2+ transporter
MRRVRHAERHFTHRIGWLRAAVLGANDGIVSTASLVVGVAAAHSGRSAVLLAGLAGLVAGAMSMAAGEYVSVSSQADTEKADLARERKELTESPEAELEELQQIYVKRGLDPDLALRVARQLSAGDILAAHARDELGITEAQAANPIQAAAASAATFSVGAALPVIVAVLAPASAVIELVAGASLISLAILGALAAGAGGASRSRGALRVTFWSALALAVTALVGHFFGATV